mmetsp:Transcript_18118/g.34379  ORF Transcript_18118/g.34379 Transcript_18118/m.34379 type:complete len:392 (-) Transcript_18118:33-1208(-)|eukprot:scaffold7349_cov173-Amphora_coffeaeformis.AAC.129
MSQRSPSRGAASRSSNTSRSARTPTGADPVFMMEPPEPRNWCCECYDPSKELLEYDYTDQNPNKDASAFPRIRERGEYYIDSFNDQPWSWTFGTHERNGIWFNSSDQAGSIMSAMVWVLLMYSQVTVTLLTLTEGIPVYLGMMYAVLVSMALACHAKTSLTDPGSVPVTAIPSERQRMTKDSHSMCGQCQTFKPPGSHHCRICNRCISRMDHHCPWMNNCVGATNLKHFLLFLIYTWSSASFALGIFGWNYFFCADEDCTFHPVVLHLVRVMTLLAIGAFLFTSSMLMNVCYGVMTGIGTIDRLKKKATNTMAQSDEEPIALIDIFGIAPWYTWPLPVDPIFEDYDRVMGYTLPQRLDRERQLAEAKRPFMQIPNTGSTDVPRCVDNLLPV